MEAYPLTAPVTAGDQSLSDFCWFLRRISSRRKQLQVLALTYILSYDSVYAIQYYRQTEYLPIRGTYISRSQIIKWIVIFSQEFNVCILNYTYHWRSIIMYFEQSFRRARLCYTKEITTPIWQLSSLHKCIGYVLSMVVVKVNYAIITVDIFCCHAMEHWNYRNEKPLKSRVNMH